ncbi:MAG: hydroxyacylglutathione hydrolase [Burkholderiales bacterium]|jgi:hydroxyacylglutathione hydrolase|nr:hydroxyacylglutathione hydrolase [Burkholderiales bacterium]
MSSARLAYQIIAIPAFSDNYIWLIHDERSAVVIDAGDAAPVIERVEALGLSVEALLCTHHHGDHVGGNEALAARYQMPVYGSIHEHIPARTHPLRGGERLIFLRGVAQCEVLATPGHTRGHLAYAIKMVDGKSAQETALFSGDTLFAAGCGRIFEGTPEEMWHSLRKLAALPPITRLYCGHEYTLANLRFAQAVEPDNPAIGEREARVIAMLDDEQPSVPTMLYEEFASNPFLRVNEPSVQTAARTRSGLPCITDIEVFSVLRQWKNDFR